MQPTPKPVDFSVYGASFQENLGRVLITDPIFAAEMQPSLKYGYFTEKHVRELIRLFFEVKEKHQIYPSIEVLGYALREKLHTYESYEQDAIVDLFAATAKPVSVSDRKFIQDTALDFCRRHALKAAILEVVDDIESGTYEDASKKIAGALRIGSGRDIGPTYETTLDLRYSPDYRHAITTGFPLLDELTEGGHGRGELTLLMAPPGIGKSQMMTIFAGNAAQFAGANVVYYTLELKARTVERRFDSLLSGIPLKELYNRRDEVRAHVEGLEGNILVQEYPTRAVSLDQIKASLDRISTTLFVPDIVVIDYPELLKLPGGKSSVKLERIEECFYEMRGIASVYNVAMLTVSQVNRQGYNEKFLDGVNVSEAAVKIHVSDLAYGFNHYFDETGDRQASLFISKNRNGLSKVKIDCEFDPGCLKLTNVRLHSKKSSTGNASKTQEMGSSAVSKALKRI